MEKVILLGANGNLGREIAHELVKQNYDVTVVVRSEEKAKSLSHITNKFLIAEACKKETLKGICEHQDIVISALGKSVSPNDKSKPTFWDVDYEANAHILEEVKKAKIKKFVYISALYSEKYIHLEYFRVHHEFSELLKNSGIDYSIIKPPAIFSAFLDLMEMAKKGQLFTLGDGDKKTNPIYEGDLAKITVDSIHRVNSIIEAGGKTIYTRKQLNEIIQSEVDESKKIRSVPLWVFKAALPLIKLFSKNTFDKLAFVLEVVQHDTLAPQLGTMNFREYVRMKLNEQK